MTEQAKIVGKIRKCLRLAGSANANEAETALRQAQALMAKYNLSRSDILAAEASSTHAKSTVKTKPTDWEAFLANKSATAFGCKLIFMTSSWASHAAWSFIGISPAPELSGYAFEVLLRQVRRSRTDYIKTELKRCRSAATKTVRADAYCRGWVVTAVDKLVAIATSQADEQAITAYMDKNHSNVNSTNARTSKAKAATFDGYKGQLAGKNATLDRGMSRDDAKLAVEHQQ
ncbi:DUF2786 domain-containing protein [Methylobacter sp. S3L5C]|uniref:DUF2786 domain-containing protein n=1 Tax=Methylobacter sp. S3L5C TaxID=2839024 RepID=UPI001FAD02FB|nr:DUF2786 domain-containing protein [Methylobacter sp. S3L5C]UOA07647.1 DUF2786 domain-containing protein [Methylobacter sp. S3L5C]UOA07803.1 DUF2786 domain-containing protein [Methylobacter sp. S3L5C]